MIVIGISGASGSGKSSIANVLYNRLKIDHKTVIISTDNFYKGLPTQVNASEYNFDHPDSVDFNHMYRCLYELQSDGITKVPIYDFTIHQPKSNTLLLENIDILILEGIYALYDRRVREMMEVKLFIDIDMDVCVLRRLMRDITERGRTVESFMVQYIAQTRPGYIDHILPYRKYADAIVENNQVSKYIQRCQSDDSIIIPIDNIEPQIYFVINKIKTRFSDSNILLDKESYSSLKKQSDTSHRHWVDRSQVESKHVSSNF